MNASLVQFQDRLDAIWTYGSVTSAHLQEGKRVVIRTNGNTLYLPDSPEAKPLTVDEIKALAEHLHWPADQTGSFDFQGRWRALIRLCPATASGQAGRGFDGGGGGGLPVLVQVRFLPHTPRDFAEYRFPSPLKESLCAKGAPGVVLIGGQALSGRKTTAAALLLAASRARGASGVSVLTLESPVGYVLTENMLTGMVTIPSTILQVEPGVDLPSWEDGVNLAMHGDWDIVSIGGTHPCGPKSECVPAAIPEIARAGKLVIATTTGSSFTECFSRACSTPDRAVEMLTAQRLSQQLRAIIV